MLNNEIQSIAATHAEWLKSGGVSGQRADFSGLDLSMADLSGIDFSDGLFVGTRLERANLSKCVLARANFRGAYIGYSNMTGANLQSADLSGVHAPGVRFESASLRNTSLGNASFENSQFTGADLGNAQGCLIRFDRCNFAHAVFDGASFEDVLFTKANLTNASVVGMRLWWGSLAGATVCGVDFATAAKLENIDSAGDLLSRKFGVGDLELSEQQMQRLNRLHRKRFDVGDIADKLGISRGVVQLKLEQLKAESTANTPAATKRRLANTFKIVGRLAFSVAGLSLFIVLMSGVADVFRLLVDRENQGFGGYWYLVWLTAALLSSAVGIYSFIKREALTQAAFGYLARREKIATAAKRNNRESAQKKRLSVDTGENN